MCVCASISQKWTLNELSRAGCSIVFYFYLKRLLIGLRTFSFIVVAEVIIIFISKWRTKMKNFFYVKCMQNIHTWNKLSKFFSLSFFLLSLFVSFSSMLDRFWKLADCVHCKYNWRRIWSTRIWLINVGAADKDVKLKDWDTHRRRRLFALCMQQQHQQFS